MTSRGPYTLPSFPPLTMKGDSHHWGPTKALPPTWPLLPYPRVSNAKYTPWKPLNTIHQDEQEHIKNNTKKTLQINPTYKQATNNNTTLYARTSMIKHGENKIQSQESYLQQRVMVTMEVWEELILFFLQSPTIFQTFSKSRDWVTTPKLLQKSTK